MTAAGTVSVLLVMVSGMGVALMTLYAYLNAVKRFARRRFPFEDHALRPPGEALRDQIENEQSELMMELVMIYVAPLLVYAIYSQDKVADSSVKLGTTIALTVLGMGTVIGLVTRMVMRLRRVIRLRTGYASEVAVGESLNLLMLQGCRVFHDVPGEKAFNVDHVVVGPAGVFAVETKTRTKKEFRNGKAEYKVVYDGNTLAFEGDAGKRLMDFLEQTRRNAEWLSGWLSKATGETVAARGVLVLPGWYVELAGKGNVLVMSHKQVKWLPKVSSQIKLSPEQVQRIAHQLEQRCRTVELAPRSLRRPKPAFS